MHEHGCRHGVYGSGEITPHDVHEASGCPMRCCRAPEMAAGDAMTKLKLRVCHVIVIVSSFLENMFFCSVLIIKSMTKLRHRSQQAFLEFNVELWASPLEREQREAQKLFQDWQTARSRILVELIAKMAFWQQLPWKLTQLGHHDKIAAAMGARRVLQLWDQQPCPHQQSRRFLDPCYTSAFPNDPPLRPLVERMANGEDICHDDFRPLRLWVARFALIKLSERSTEGVHSVVSHCMKRAPAASVAYISIELRFKDFMARIAREPLVP